MFNINSKQWTEIFKSKDDDLWPELRRLHKTAIGGADNEFLFLFGGHKSDIYYDKFLVYNWQINAWFEM